MARFLTDEDVPFLIAQGLRSLGHDVLTTADAGLAGRGTPDHLVFELAIESQRTVITRNRSDFRRLHRRNSEHFGMILVGQHDILVALDQIVEALAMYPLLSSGVIAIRADRIVKEA